jgi:hypothetical protein
MLKKTMLILAGLLSFLMLTTPAHAGKGFVQYAYGPHVTHIAELPTDIQAMTGASGLKLGFRHERTELYWMPVWGTTKGAYVFYQESGDGWRSFPVPPAALPELGSALGMNLTSGSPVSFFSLVWGWLIYAPLLLFVVMATIRNKSPKEKHYDDQRANYVDLIEAAVQHRAQTAFQTAAASRTQTSGRPVFGKR